MLYELILTANPRAQRLTRRSITPPSPPQIPHPSPTCFPSCTTPTHPPNHPHPPTHPITPTHPPTQSPPLTPHPTPRQDSCLEYLSEEKLRELVQRYSEFINFPIYMLETRTEEKEVGESGQGVGVGRGVVCVCGGGGWGGGGGGGGGRGGARGHGRHAPPGRQPGCFFRDQVAMLVPPRRRKD